MAENYFDKDVQLALGYYEKAFAQAKKTNDFTRMSNLCVDISTVYHYNTDYQKALDKCKEGIYYQAKSKVKADTIAFKLYASTATMFKGLSFADSAKYYFELANILLSKSPHVEAKIPEYVSNYYNNYGRFLNNYSDYPEGIIFIEKALLVAQKYNLTEDEGYILTNLCDFYEILGENDKALRYIEKANQDQKELNQLKCFILSQLGWCQILNNKYTEGISNLKKAFKLTRMLEANKKMGENVDLKALILYNLGIGYQKSDKTNEAERYFLQSIALLTNNKKSKHRTLSKSYLRLSELHEVSSPKVSLSYVQKSLTTNFTDFDSQDIFQNPSSKGLLNQSLGIQALTRKSALLFSVYQQVYNAKYLDLSLEVIQNCLNLIKDARNNYDKSESKLIFNNSIHSSYQLAVKIAYEKFRLSGNGNDKKYVLYLIENSKSTELNEALRISSIKPDFVPRNLLKKEDSLNALILKAKKQIEPSRNEYLHNLEIERINLLRLIEKKSPDYYRLKFEVEKTELEDIQKNLAINEAFLSYFSTHEEMFIVIVTKQLFEIKKVVITETFVNSLNAYKNILYQNPGFGNYEGAKLSSFLYSYLIYPIKDYIPGHTRLIIEKDWLINFLPFEVLESGQSANDFLIKKYSIRYIYSAKQITHDTGKLTSVKTLGIAPFNDKYLKSSLKYLPNSEKQIATIANEVLLGKEATKNNFLKYYQDFNVIYFATHSQINYQLPNKSTIFFYPEGDSQLTMEEIYNLKLFNTKMVVLSACDAGIGKLHQSEGMLSIARAFSFAGCPATVSTLWITNDESATLLTERMHDYLEKGLPKDIALQKTKLDFINSKFANKFNHPHFWANMILTGDDEAVFQPINNQKYVILVLVFLLSGGALFITFKRSVIFRKQN